MRLLKFLIRSEVLKSSGKFDAEDGKAGEKSCELDQGRGYGRETEGQDLSRQLSK